MLTIVISDLHIPYHDEDAIKWALNYIVKRRPKKLIINGDLIDFYSISRFPKHPVSADFGNELETTLKVLDKFFGTLKKVKSIKEIVYIEGNHSLRLRRYLWRQAPELSNVPALTVPRLLQLDKFIRVKWQYKAPYGVAYLEQGVIVTHGKRFAANTCERNLQDYGCSSVVGHSHRLAIRHRRLPDGRIISAAEGGCLCSFEVEYCTFPNWQHGLVEIENGIVRIIRKEQ